MPLGLPVLDCPSTPSTNNLAREQTLMPLSFSLLAAAQRIRCPTSLVPGSLALDLVGSRLSLWSEPP